MSVRGNGDGMEEAGALWVLEQALSVPRNSKLRVLIIHDEHTEAIASRFFDAATHLGARPSCLKVHSDTQAVPANQLPRHIWAEIDHSPYVVFLQKRAKRSNKFRLKVLDYCGSGTNRRTASMPGIQLQHLQYCAGDIFQLRSSCEALTERLLWARTVTLHTRCPRNLSSTAELGISLGRFLPVSSSGHIAPGTWGNVPSGESFIIPDNANGQVYITGSMLNYPMRNGDSVLLTITDGQVTSIKCDSAAAAAVAHDLLLLPNGTESVKGCCILAELGFGLNPIISEYSGIPLLDEKICGTVHLGFGSNEQFGGHLKCDVHNDFVIARPDVAIDGDEIIKDGVGLAFNPSPNWKHINPRFLKLDKPISLKETPEFLDKGGGQLFAQRKWNSHRSPKAIISNIGDPETSRYAAIIASQFIEHKGHLFISDIAANGVPRQALTPIVDLMLRHNILGQEQ